MSFLVNKLNEVEANDDRMDKAKPNALNLIGKI